jgi:type IV secretion system protein VirB1
MKFLFRFKTSLFLLPFFLIGCFIFFLVPKLAYAGFWHTCSVYASPVTMEKIVYVESGGKPFVIHDNTANKSYIFSNKLSAVRQAKYLINSGHNIDMGLAQINSVNVSKFNISLMRVFNPCYNIYVGSYILYKDYNKAVLKFGNTHTALFRTLEAYNSGSFYGDKTYAFNVWNALNK